MEFDKRDAGQAGPSTNCSLRSATGTLQRAPYHPETPQLPIDLRVREKLHKAVAQVDLR
jgi:hypothetical protein